MTQVIGYYNFYETKDNTIEVPLSGYDDSYASERKAESLAWYYFRKKYHLGRNDNLEKWHDLYLRLCAAGLLN